MTIIREASDTDFEEIWPIFHKIVSAGDTYAYPQNTTREEAFRLWMQLPQRTYVAEVEGQILGTYYIKTNKSGPGSHVCNCGYMVSSQARGKGLATSMCEHSQKLAVELGYKAMQFNFVAVSNDSAQFAREELRVPEKKLRFIPNGVDVEWLRSPQAPREETRKQLGLAERDFVIGCVARFHPVKDHETLLRAFEKLRRSKEGKHARLLLVGKGEDGLKVRALAEQLRLLEHVVFTGFRRDLPEIYSAMDAFCLTSRHEGMPTAVLEAMAATRPIVATEVPGTSDVLHHGQNALLAPAGDATAIALALARIINDPELASRLTRQASADVSERYGIKACAAAYCTLIRELL